MAESYTLEAQPRTLIGKKVGQLRRAGIVPVVVYGAKVQPMHLQINERVLTNTLYKAGGTHIINIDIEGKTQQVIARDVQRDVMRGNILHVDFLAIDATTLISAEIPVHFSGESPAVETGQGILMSGISSVTIEALPSDLIDRIEVDLSLLKNVNDTMYVRDLKLGDKIAVLTDEDAMIVRVITTAAQEAAAAAEEELASTTTAEPEVIEKGKKEEEFED